ncbi:vWA domain-containing protein [Natrinema gelatinilyticum]|uniref:vWA domain-containing protein n=1 Tax=Natrinema gelatinilyticum TaxID=2961571 RepID=UPI0020C488BC|nr:VWA domain-containing protein [Natrinema gelatinilyticum]
MTDDAGDALLTVERVRWRLVEFTRALRTAGVDVSATASLDAARVLAELGAVDRERTRAGLRAALVTDPGDVETFDRLFAAFWRQLVAELEGRSNPENAREPDRSPEILDLPDADPSALEGGDDAEIDAAGLMMGLASESDDERPHEDDETVAGYSRRGRSTAISARTGGTDDDLEAVTKRISDALAKLAGRGYAPADSGGRLDVRRALRESYGTGGIVVSMPTRARKRTATRCLFLVDVSRSVLDVIDRDFLVRCLASFQAASRSVRTFFFDTSLQEVTDAFTERTPTDAYDALERLEAEWGGGTQIGEAITRIREEYPHAVDRRTAVIVISDGFETGDVDILEDGMAWITRRASLVLWWNPLATSSTYEPTCRGMAAAVPFVDGLFAFAGIDDARKIARQLERYDGTQPLGYERATGSRLPTG